MVKGPENLAYYMLDYDINVAHWILIYIAYTLQMTTNVNVVHRMKIQFII
jgi:hypothetical protein